MIRKSKNSDMPNKRRYNSFIISIAFNAGQPLIYNIKCNYQYIIFRRVRTEELEWPKLANCEEILMSIATNCRQIIQE